MLHSYWLADTDEMNSLGIEMLYLIDETFFDTR